MQREIKFRGKRLDNWEWVYGDYYKKSIIRGYKQRIAHYIGWPVIDKDVTWNEYEEIDPHTVCQYTGLKDKNGIELYEEDVVCLGDIKRRTGVIVRSDTKPAFVLEVNDTAFDLYYRNQHRYEVIGNIHDNPELLKTEK